MAAWIKMPLGMEVSLGPGDLVLDGDHAPPPQKGQIFGPCLLWPNGWMDQDGTWHGGRTQPRRLCVRRGTQPPGSPSPGGAPQCSAAHVYCGQTAAWIKMPLRTEVSLGPDDIVLYGDPAPPSLKRGQSPLPNFRPMSIVTKLLGGSRWHLAWRWAFVQATLC